MYLHICIYNKVVKLTDLKQGILTWVKMSRIVKNLID